MRLLSLVPALVLLALAPAAARAQCATGCTSSTSCDGTGKSYCGTACGVTAGVSWCSCQDKQCGTTQLRPVALEPAPAARRAAMGTASAPAARAALLEDCRGNVLDVRLFAAAGGGALFPQLRTIPLRRPGPAPLVRVATRE